MTEASLAGRHILVVEDEYFIAAELSRSLEDMGAIVVGPVATSDKAIAIVETAGARIDGAVLDINLEGMPAYVVAETLARRAIPFVFATGYDAAAIDARFQHVPRCEKPVKAEHIARALLHIPDRPKAG
jgi:DNA-binding LytR/AlgR family response regulator